jgi:hypothetical protein
MKGTAVGSAIADSAFDVGKEKSSEGACVGLNWRLELHIVGILQSFG